MATRKIPKRTQFLRLNGSTNYVGFSSYVPNPTAFSIAFWFKPKTGNANNARIVDYQDSGPASGFTLNMSVANNPKVLLIFNAVGGGEIASIAGTGMKMAEWNLVVATYAVNSVKLYVNSVQQGSTDTSCTMAVPAAALTIGSRSTGLANFCRGLIHTFLAYPRVLTQTEINDLYYSNIIPVTPDVYLKMDDRSGSSLIDYSGNSVTGTLSGTALYGTEPSERMGLPKYAKAVDFSSPTTSKIAIDDTAILRPDTTKKFTWMCWVKLNKTNNNVLPRLIEKGSHYNCIMGDQTNASANYMALEIENVGNPASEYWGTSIIPTNRWVHLTTTFDEGTCQHYINGRPDAMRLIGNAYVDMTDSSAGKLNFGNTTDSDRNLAGLMQGVKVYNVSLTEDEVYQESQGGNVTRGLVGKYNLDEGAGTTVADTSENGNDGTLTDGVWKTGIATSRTTATNRQASSNRTSV